MQTHRLSSISVLSREVEGLSPHGAENLRAGGGKALQCRQFSEMEIAVRTLPPQERHGLNPHFLSHLGDNALAKMRHHKHEMITIRAF